MDESPAPLTPRVTALVTVLNQKDDLRRCLKALEASTDRDTLEILVVDRGSRDGSAELEAEFPAATFLRMPRNFGRTKAWNIGVRTAAGELLLLLSPLVEVQPDTIARLAARLEPDDSAAAVSPLITTPAGEPATRSHPLPTAPLLYQAWRNGGDLPTLPLPEAEGTLEWTPFEALLVRKYFVRGINFFDERYGDSLADAEFSFQIRRAGRKIVYLPEVRVLLHEKPALVAPPAVRVLVAADFLSGVATFAAKRSGFLAGIGYRLRAAGACLLAALTFRDPGYNLKLLIAVLSGQKIDGFQSVAV
jgi:GT2 family glycosyltransferase